MRTVRVWLLLLLAVLLPLRGAVAAGMLCPVAGSGIQSELMAHAHPASHRMMDDSAGHDHAAMHHEHSSDGHHDHGAADKCNMCSAFCSVTPLVSSLPTLFEPLDMAATSFPDLSAPAPTFVSGGQERPPRSI